MNIFHLSPEYSDWAQKVAARLDDGAVVFAFDEDDTRQMKPGDVFENSEDGRLYKVAEIEHDDEESQHIVKADAHFKIDAEEFNGLMRKVACMCDVEARHSAGDALMAHALTGLDANFEYGVREFTAMKKWYG